jgi:hypothetical protein
MRPAFVESYRRERRSGLRRRRRGPAVAATRLIALDCDTLIVAGDDLRVMVDTSGPGTEDAERLALAVVLGTQSLVG